MRTRLALAALPLALIAACGDDKPKSIDVNGSVVLNGDIGDEKDMDDLTTPIQQAYGDTEAKAGDLCAGKGGYSDVTQGAQVSIVDNDGKTLGLGDLGDGKLNSSGNYGNGCRFTFTVKDVDAGQKFYTIKVGHRDGPQFTLDQLKEGPGLTIGSAS